MSHDNDSRSQVYFPNGVKAPDVIPRLLKKDVVVAGGLHKDHKGSFSPPFPPQRIADVVRGRLQISTSVLGMHVFAPSPPLGEY